MALNPSTPINETVSVRVRNVGDRRLQFRYANQRYTIEAGGEVIAPYLAACLWFGDPRSRDIGDKRSTHYRSNEIDRLGVRYGLFDDPFWDEYNDGLTTSDLIKTPDEKIPGKPYNGTRHPNLPRVEVYDLGTGERILTVIDDPRGDQMAPTTNAEVEARALAAQMEQMKAQLANLQNELLTRDPQLAESVMADQALPTAPGTDTDSIADALSDEVVSDPTPSPDARPTRDTGGRTPRAKSTTSK